MSWESPALPSPKKAGFAGKNVLLSPDDCVFVVAFPTMTESERWVSRYAHRKQAALLTLTDSEITAKQLGADLFAVINERADTFFNSYVLPMAFCNGLLCASLN